MINKQWGRFSLKVNYKIQESTDKNQLTQFTSIPNNAISFSSNLFT